MKVLLSTPPRFVPRAFSANDFPEVFGPHPAVTLPLLAACASPGVEVKLVDARVARTNVRTWCRLVREADVLGISCSAPVLALDSEVALRLAKKVNPKIRVVLGGHHPTVHATEWLERGADVVVLHEGERTFEELSRHMAEGKGLDEVASICFSADGKHKFTAERNLVSNLDSLPLPRWDLLDLRPYRQFTGRRGLTLAVEVTRGCSNRCRFCLVSQMWKGQQRYKSIPRVLEEIDMIVKLGATQAIMVGDGFGNPPDYFLELCRAMQAKSYDLAWVSFLPVDAVVREPLLPRAMAQAGCKAVFMGFESPLETALRQWNKGWKGSADPNTYKEVYKILDREGILVFGFLIVGHPLEPPDMVLTLLERHLEWCDFPLINPLQPMKGTALYEEYREKGLLLKDMFYHDITLPSVKGTLINVQRVNRRFMRDLLLRYPLGIFSGKETVRQFTLHLYRYLVRELLGLSWSAVRDYRRLATARYVDPAKTQEEYVQSYLSDKYINALASKGL